MQPSVFPSNDLASLHCCAVHNDCTSLCQKAIKHWSVACCCSYQVLNALTWKNVWLQTGAVLIPFFQQFTGINTIMFYATQLFAVLGQSGNAALLSTAIVGAVNVGSTIIAIILVDRLVRTSSCLCHLPTANAWHACSPDSTSSSMLHMHHAPAVLWRSKTCCSRAPCT